MSRWVFDIEGNALLVKVTRMHILVAFNLDTRKLHYWLEGDLGWKEEFSKATLLVGHNITGYDLPTLWKLFKFKPQKGCRIHDTLVLSQTLDYKRFGANGHSLAAWGEFFGFPKIDFDQFDEYSEEMKTYCIRDVDLAVKVYEYLTSEFNELYDKNKLIAPYVRAETAAGLWSSYAELHGWPFDMEGAKKLMFQLEEEMGKAYQALNSKLGTKVVPKDKVKGIVEWKKPKWTMKGCYDAHTANWFNIDPWSGYQGEERMVEGPYSRIEIVPLSLDSVTDVKIFLYRHGWQPTTWNYTHDENGKKVKSSPKVTEDSLEFLGGDGKLYSDFLTTKARYSILKTWIENTDKDGNLHGSCMVIGTPSMRARHSIIVNVPAADKPWGKEMRSLFTSLPGWVVIGCDSAGNQARGLAHYLGDPGFIDTLLNGDIHSYNADVLTSVIRDLRKQGLNVAADFVVTRPMAKRILYAFLFGASGGKLWSYIFGVIDDTWGKKLRLGFLKAVPGFKDLLTKLENIYGKTSQYGDGYIPSIAGCKLYVDSFHKLLVYLLQACEKATCAAALMLTMEALEEAGIPYQPCIFYHDEIDFMVPVEYAEQAAAIGKQAFVDGPKLFGIEIMDGEAKIGNNWYDVH
jgi:DNA polymerase I-like protein with 3'-5' exonuclease and polymerase domains